MKTTLKTGIFSAVLALLVSMPSGNANAGAGVCWRQYLDCIAAGIDETQCETGYYICRYGYIPAKPAAIPLVPHQRD